MRSRSLLLTLLCPFPLTRAVSKHSETRAWGTSQTWIDPIQLFSLQTSLEPKEARTAASNLGCATTIVHRVAAATPRVAREENGLP